VERSQGVIWVHTRDTNAPNVLAKVFGVVSTSPAMSVQPDIGELSAAAVELAGRFLGNDQSFAIRTRRTGELPFTSMDLAVRAGDDVRLGLKGRKPAVDLTNPDLEIHLDARPGHGFAYVEKVDGVGGMPLDSQGKMVCLMSGGIDSPVASWLMMKRGCVPVFCYMDGRPYSDNNTRRRALDCMERMREWAPGRKLKIYEVPYGDVLQRFTAELNRRYTCVLCKRFMFRVAELVARRENAHGIVTGSSLGQVASQTSQNMLTEARGLDCPLYHPLIGMDKSEITALARRIGTFDISTRAVTPCGAVPRYPIIRADAKALEQVEERLDMGELAREALRRAEVCK
jgi:thiamine biosynthesis protein ThiI